MIPTDHTDFSLANTLGPLSKHSSPLKHDINCVVLSVQLAAKIVQNMSTGAGIFQGTWY